MKKKFFALLCMFLIITTPFSYSQLSSSDPDEEEMIAEDIIINIADYQPKVVSSANIEAGNYNVYALLSGIQSNPTIDIPKIKSISVRQKEGNRYVAGISHVRPKKGDITLDNMGYIQIRLRKLKEEEVPDEIVVDMTAKVTFDVTRGFGVNSEDKVLQEQTEDEWLQERSGQFWGGRGYIRADKLDWNEGTFVVYDSNLRKSKISLEVRGRPSGARSLGNVFGENKLRFIDKYQVRLNSISGPRNKAVIDLLKDGNYESVTLVEDQKLYGGSEWFVDRIMKNQNSESVILRNKATGSSATLTKTPLIGDVGCGIFEKEKECKESGYCEWKEDKCIVKEEKKEEDKTKITELSEEEKKEQEAAIARMKARYEEIKKIDPADFKDWNKVKEAFDAYVSFIRDYKDKDYASVFVAQAQKRAGEMHRYYLEKEGSEEGNTEALNYITKELNSLLEILPRETPLVTASEELGDDEEGYYKRAIEAYKEVVYNYPGAFNGTKAAKAQLEIAKIYDFHLADLDNAINAYHDLLIIFGDIEFVKAQEDAIRFRIRVLQDLANYRSIAQTIYEGDEESRALVVRLIDVKEVDDRDKATVKLTVNGVLQEIKQGDSIEDFWILSGVDRDRIWIKDSEGRSNSIRVGESGTLSIADPRKSITINVIEIDTKKEAHVTILPGAETAISESDFRIHIPVEKRPFKLSPETIDSHIRSTEELIQDLNTVIQKIEDFYELWSYYCYTVFSVVWIKNFFRGFAGRNAARTHVIDQWKTWCNENIGREDVGGYKNVDDCIKENAGVIGKDIDEAQKSVQETKEIIENDKWKGEYPEYANLDEDEAQDIILKEKLSKVEWQNNEIKDEFIRDFVQEDYLTRNVKDIEAQLEKFREDALKGEYAQYDRYSRNEKAWETLTSKETSDGEKREAIEAIIANEYTRARAEENPLSAVNQYNEYDPSLVTDALQRLEALSLQEGTINGEQQIDQIYIYKRIDETPAPSVTAAVFDKWYYSGNGIEEQLFNEDGTPLQKRPVIGGKYKLKNGASVEVVNNKGVIKEEEHEQKISLYASGRHQGKLERISVDPYHYLEIERYSNGDIQKVSLFRREKANDIMGSEDDTRVKVIIDEALKESWSTSSCKDALRKQGIKQNDLNACDRISKIENELKKKNKEIGENIEGYIISQGAQISSASSCFEIMDPSDCILLFGACDPVMCPPSRFDRGGKWPVSNVVQTGVVGSLVLGPWEDKSIKEPLPICIPGVLAGLKNYRSLLEGYKECLTVKKEKGENVGICDKIRSFGVCKIFWKEGLALFNVEGGLLGVLSKQVIDKGSGGGEYAYFKENLKQTNEFVKFFTQEYATTFFAAYRGGSTEEIGTQLCQRAIYGKVPGQGSFVDQLLRPESPPQFIAVLNEVPHSEVTGEFLSDYDVWYHIYAGDDKDIRYRISMIDAQGRRLTLTGIKVLEKSGFEDETLRKNNAVSGFEQVCVWIDGFGETCGFGKTSSGYLMQYLDQKMIENEINNRNIKSEKECLGETGLVSGGLQVSEDDVSFSRLGINAGSALDILSSGITETGVERRCSLQRPDLGERNEEESKWAEVGICGKDSLGRDLGKCWLNKDAADLLRNREKGDEYRDILDRIGREILSEEEIKKLKEEIEKLLTEADEADKKNEIADAKEKYLDAIEKYQKIVEGTLDIDTRAENQFEIGKTYVKIAVMLGKQKDIICCEITKYPPIPENQENIAVDYEIKSRKDCIDNPTGNIDSKVVDMAKCEKPKIIEEKEEELLCEIGYVDEKTLRDSTLIFAFQYGEWLWKSEGGVVYKKLSDPSILNEEEVFQDIVISLQDKDVRQGVRVITSYVNGYKDDYLNIIKGEEIKKLDNIQIKEEDVLSLCEFIPLPPRGEKIPLPEEIPEIEEEEKEELRSELAVAPWEIEYEEEAIGVTNLFLSYKDQQWLFRFKTGGGPFGLGGPLEKAYEEYSPIDEQAILYMKRYIADIYENLAKELQEKNFEEGLSIILNYANQNKDDYLILHKGNEQEIFDERTILQEDILDFFGYIEEPRYKEVIESPIPTVAKPINVGRIIQRIQRYDNIIELYSKQQGLDSTFVRAIISRESQGIPNIGSSAGAVGLMQVMPNTARGECEPRGNVRSWLKDPTKNIDCGTTVYANYYRQVQQFVRNKGGSISDTENLMKLTLAAYNGGPARVECLINQYGWRWDDIFNKASGKFGKECKHRGIRGYVRLPVETKNYVGFVLGYYYYYKEGRFF